MANRQPLPWEEIGYGQGFDLFFLALSGHATCFWPFTRRHFGVQALHLNGLAAIGLMWVYAAFAPCVELITFLVVWLALVVVHRVVTLAKVWRGWQEHSRFDGDPWLIRAICRPFLRSGPSDVAAKAVGEPVLCLVAGALLYPSAPALGVFVAAGAVSLAVKKGIECGFENAELRVMRDKEIEMRQRFARYRARR